MRHGDRQLDRYLEAYWARCLCEATNHTLWRTFESQGEWQSAWVSRSRSSQRSGMDRNTQ